MLPILNELPCGCLVSTSFGRGSTMVVIHCDGHSDWIGDSARGYLEYFRERMLEEESSFDALRHQRESCAGLQPAGA